MEKRPQGRPPLPPGKALKPKTIRLSPAHWEKIRDAGLPALRKLLDEWQPKGTS